MTTYTEEGCPFRYDKDCPDPHHHHKPTPTPTPTKALREALAAIEHKRWADWQAWVFEQYGIYNNDGSFTISKERVENMQRQIDLSYAELTRKKLLNHLVRYMAESRSRLIDEIEAAVRDIRWPDKGNGAKGSIMWSQFIGHEKALDKVKKILEEAKNG